MPLGLKLTRRWLVIAGIGALMLAGVVVMLRPRPVAVDMARLETGPMRVTVDEEGKTRIKEVYVVSAPVGGKVLRAPFDPGDAVEKGRSVVAVIEPSDPAFLDVRTRSEIEAQVNAARAAVDLADAEVHQVETEVAWAASELTRAQALAKSSTVSLRNLERARLDLEAKRAALVRAKANRDLRKAELASVSARMIGPESRKPATARATCCVEVVAPESGEVLRKLQDSETVVLPGAALVEVGDPANLEIVVELLSSDAVKVTQGAEASIDGTGLPKVLKARVRRIEPAGFTKVSALGIEEQRVKAILDFEDKPIAHKALGHEFRIFARIVTWSSQNALRVPLSALFRRGERWAVFKVVDGRARISEIEIGHRNADHAEVLGGAMAGERIILHPSDRVSDGSRVEAR